MILNLAYPEKSAIKFKISKFPDGQHSITLEPIPNYTDPIVIKSRLNNFMDLELIICANQALKSMNSNKLVELYVPYFLGGRSDRKFVDGSVNYLKQVICPIINSQNFSKITIFDPHSDVLEACLNNYDKINNYKLIKWALTQIDNKDGAQTRTMLVSPDAGALKKVYDVAKFFKIRNVATAAKVRDVITGDILRTDLPTMNLEGIEQIVIVDDMADGGRTFIELAKEIKKQTDKPIYLIVSHGIFSGGFEKLSDELDGIFCTNSVKDVNTEIVKTQSRQNSSNFVKQLNVF